MAADISTRIVRFLVDKCRLAEDEITLDAEFSGLDLDSLSLMELSLALEKQLGVRIEEGVLTPELTVAGAAALLDERRARSDVAG
ncbi:acyl carrier protein [Actinocrispum wychmicini]|uniref:Acyl carrier protein n=1 Tax=Actinocrispum wychmicini TaxID=1213861 RepID=A0A4R2JQ10_9PSEU|nr:acyl carrier protein [Actinocrispum wychmicini]TCO62291.1 acyl carrier protein [Actinocrispum wychmicini]